MALRETSRLGKFIGPRLLYRSSQCKCEKASFHEVIWERSHPRRGGLGVDAGWGRLRRPGGALNYWRNFCTEPTYLSPPHTPQPILLPTLQFLQESFIILPDYNSGRMLGA